MLIGFMMIILIVWLLLKNKMSSMLVLTLVPTLSAVLLGYNIVEISDFIKNGIEITMNNAVLFIFSVLYFGIMSETGMFDVIVDFLIKKAGNNIIAVTVATSIIATIAHLDGTASTTVLITIPSLYPIYKAMNIDTKILLCITGACTGVMNFLPWGGPVARVATILSMDANDLWLILIPLQIIGVLANIIVAILLGIFALKNGAGKNLNLQKQDLDEIQNDENDLKRPKLLFFNMFLTITLIILLSIGYIHSYVGFLFALVILLMVNYPNLQTQDILIKKYAPTAIMISITLFSAGALVGILDGTNMLVEMANFIINMMPDILGEFIHIVFGVLSLPLGICIGTDAYFYGIMPLVITVGESYGVSSLETAITMMIGKNLALLVSPLVPATFLAIGLTQTELKDHMKFSIPIYWIISVIILFITVIGR